MRLEGVRQISTSENVNVTPVIFTPRYLSRNSDDARFDRPSKFFYARRYLSLCGRVDLNNMVE